MQFFSLKLEFRFKERLIPKQEINIFYRFLLKIALYYTPKTKNRILFAI